MTVEKLYTSSFHVEFQLKGTVADGYQAGTAAINPETVVVSGCRAGQPGEQGGGRPGGGKSGRALCRGPAPDPAGPGRGTDD
ncbi:MAG: hypothetical protein V8S34_07935 [Lawsonibacter sp.]